MKSTDLLSFFICIFLLVMLPPTFHSPPDTCPHLQTLHFPVYLKSVPYNFDPPFSGPLKKLVRHFHVPSKSFPTFRSFLIHSLGHASTTVYVIVVIYIFQRLYLESTQTKNYNGDHQFFQLHCIVLTVP